jgi:hypothetical protein
MALAHGSRSVRLGLERLESREVPTTSPWALQTFDQTPVGALPQDWSQHPSDGTSGFQTTPDHGLASQTTLTTDGTSASVNRAWLNTPLPADAQVSVNVYLDSLIPVQIIARGQNLDTDTPSYYAVSVTRGVQLQLLRVVDGQTTVLDSLQSNDYLSGQWARISLTAIGNTLQVQVFRTDTAKFLNANGDWQTAPTSALSAQDGTISAGGQAGLGRPASYAGVVHFDTFEVGPPPAEAPVDTLVDESFTRPAPGGLPAGWTQWTSGTSNFQVSTALALTDNAGLTLVNPTTDPARVWLDTDVPADANVSAALFLNNAAPGEIIARGQNLDTPTPTYYAVAVTRGLELKLLRVTDGQITVLQTLDSQQWLGEQWLSVTFSLQGDDLRVMAYRNDTGQYLDSSGNWSVNPVWAMETHDSAIQGPGRAGLGHSGGLAGSVTFDSFTVTRSEATTITQNPGGPYNFDGSPVGSVPDGWNQWTSNQSPSFQVSTQAALSGNQSLMTDGGSDLEAHAWLTQPQDADVQVDGAIYLNSLEPAQFVVRGQNLDSASASYYALSISRGVDAQLIRVDNGQTTVLSSLSSNEWDSGMWVHVSLIAQGSTLQAQIIRADTGQYLNQDGDWQSDPAIAMSVNDSGLTSGGFVGIVRPASYSGPLYFDDFNSTSLATAPPPPDTGGNTNPPTSDPGSTTPPPPSDPGTITPPTSSPGDPGPVTPPVTPPAVPPASLPPVPRHYSHIRIAELAYSGTPMDSFTQSLLRNSVDIVIPNTDYLSQINSIAGPTPQFIYSNASNIYRELLTDWLNYADAHGIDREAAFYHVTQATPFTGDSASSWPVAWFWSVQVGSNGNWTDVTSIAHSASSGPVQFGSLGQSLVLGNTEQFREMNFNLAGGAANGWSGVLEYASAVDANGNPTTWSTLRTISDETNGFQNSGRVTFDPPSDWVTASINGSPRLYYVRIRTTSDGTAPVAATILGRDYVNANGTDHGVIPAFDYSADTNHDGYLSDAEYANRRPGMDARFVYETRAFYPAYGQNRFATNVGNPFFQQWTADYAFRFLQANPGADGLFMDNSLSKIAFDPKTIKESLDNYAQNYANLLAQVNQRIAPKWVIANVAGGGVSVDNLAKLGISYLEEFALRPMSASYSQFEDVAGNLERRLSLSNGKSYAILDSLATGDQELNPRWQIGTLAYYYLLADPNQTLLMFNGGNEPNSTWARHWSAAAEFDVGQPTDEWSVFGQGRDPNNGSMTYKVYERHYDNALILYKPLSYFQGKAGTTADSTATTHNLGGTYRPLNADGTLGAPITQITLRNGEGAILVRA